MTSNRPLEDWGKLLGDVPSATAILDRFLQHAEVVTMAGKSYRLRNKIETVEEAPESKPAKMLAGNTRSGSPRKASTPATEPATACEL